MIHWQRNVDDGPTSRGLGSQDLNVQLEIKRKHDTTNILTHLRSFLNRSQFNCDILLFYISSSSGTRVNLFGGKPLGIFNNPDLLETSEILETWAKLDQREIVIGTRQPPRNYFENMALWTEHGKVWKFPIDNEQGKKPLVSNKIAADWITLFRLCILFSRSGWRS